MKTLDSDIDEIIYGLIGQLSDPSPKNKQLLTELILNIGESMVPYIVRVLNKTEDYRLKATFKEILIKMNM